MLSMNLWSKASEFGSKLKDSLQLSASDKPLIEKEVYDKLKEEYDQLKKECDEKTQKYEKIMKEINNKDEKEENLTDNELKEYLNEITNKFKNYVLNFYGDNNILKDEIDLIFANTHNENFDYKIKEYDRNKFESTLINNLISNNKDIIEDLFLYKYSSNEDNNNQNNNKYDNNKNEKKEKK